MARSFTRRDFLSGSLGVGAAGAVHATLGGPVGPLVRSRSATRARSASGTKAPEASASIASPRTPAAKRALVLCTLFGGNDGLNTVIPYESSAYRQLRGQIAIPGLKPRRLSQLPHRIETIKSVALHAPAALLAQFAGQHVGDGIEIGRNVQSPPQHVVAGIHDEGQLFRTKDLAQSIDELGAARAAGQYRDHATLRA